MAKIRIYELARELGVENKIVVDKAQEMGIPGVKSHSNSLDTHDADNLRRAFLKQAAEPIVKKEVIRRTVDRDTGETNTVVERRSGNVIRRRKKGEQESVTVASSSFLPAEVLSDESQDTAFDSTLDITTDETTDNIELSYADLDSQQDSEEVTSLEVSDDGKAEVIEASQSAASTTTEVEEQEVKRAGPKILGKIELVRPTTNGDAKKGVVKKKTFKKPGSAVTTEEEEETDRNGNKKRGKKREFTRNDLLDYEGLGQRRTGRTGKRKRGHEGDDLEEDKVTEITVPKASKRIVKMDEMITVGDLAGQLSLKVGEVIKKLIELGIMATINQAIDQDTATIIAEEFEFQVESTSFDESEILVEAETEEDEAAISRSPVVTVMGHVDHGKTSLLDTIRKSSVAEKEHGGITQHIGAYQVSLDDGRNITFIDTPGHAAFTEMRARGAKVTDIVILVVAADDGVMPQTLEAMSHAKAAGVPIVVAVNKMDKPSANPDKIKQQLADRGLQPEDWGGDTLFFPISAMTGQGIQELLEGLLLVAELQDFKANPDRKCVGVIIEARQERGKGVVATVLVQRGTLKSGQIFVCGAQLGRVRSMMDYKGKEVGSAGPSVPVEITGFSAVPAAGDDFIVVDSEANARSVVEHRAEKQRRKDSLSLAGGPISLEEFSKQAGRAKAAECNIIVKADVHGSLEAVKDALVKLSGEQVKVQVLHGGVGAVSENDVQLAIASRAMIVGFNVRAESRAADEAERNGVELRFYRVIYELIDDVKLAMTGLLQPIRQEKPIAKVEVRDTFTVPKIGKIAGGYVMDGTARRGAFVRLLRDSAVIHEGRVSGLRRFKDDVKEVQSGYECGISLENYNDIKIGDVIELFEVEEIKPSLADLNIAQ